MKRAFDRPRLRAWSLVWLAAVGTVGEGVRPTIDAVRAEPLPVPALDTPETPAPPEGMAVMSDVRCDAGVAEDVPGPSRPCPVEMAKIGGYCIDRWEAHLVVRDGTGERRHPHYLRPDEEGVTYEARSAPGVYPQAYISRTEAQRACQAAGKRLCTWLEWRRGCQGTHWQTFPYGDALIPERCNHVKEHLFGRLFGQDARRWKQSDFNDPRINQEPGFLAKTGEYAGCESPDGIFDAVGNLHEWVIDRVTVDFMNRMAEERVYRAKQPWREGNGMFMGGFYSTRGQHGPGCFFTTVAHGPSYHDYSTGFRCCRDARADES